MPSLTLHDLTTRATMADDAKPKGKKWVSKADKASKGRDEPAFKPRSSAARRAALYDHKGK